MNIIDEKLAEILHVLLKIPVDPTDNISMQNCATWDSLKHIEIIMTIEQHFCISLPPEDIPNLISQNLLAEKIKKLVKDV